MGFEERAFREDEDALIAQALNINHAWFAGITKERLERERALRQLSVRLTVSPICSPFAYAM